MSKVNKQEGKMKKNFENTVLFYLYRKCDGISDNFISLKATVMNRLDKKYSPKIQRLVDDGLLGIYKSNQAGVFCKIKYCLTVQGCQVASEIDYESIKDSVDKWDRLLNAQAEKSPIKKQKKSSPTPTEEKEESSIPLLEKQTVPSEILKPKQQITLPEEQQMEKEQAEEQILKPEKKLSESLQQIRQRILGQQQKQQQVQKQPEIDNDTTPSEKHASLLEEIDELSWQSLVDSADNKCSEDLSYDRERQLELLRLIEDM